METGFVRNDFDSGRKGIVVCMVLLLGLILFTGCASNDSGKSRPLPIQMQEVSEQFFEEVSRSGSAAQSYFTIFLPEGTINARHLLAFEKEAEKALRKAAAVATMHYNGSAERVFFLSKHKADGWEPPASADQSGEVMAAEFRRGSSEGWTILHAFWAQFNRLLIGDATWIQHLPESIRADLSHPLRYVVRIGVAQEANPNMMTFVHKITFELIEVGKERTVYSGSYPLILSYSLL